MHALLTRNDGVEENDRHEKDEEDKYHSNDELGSGIQPKREHVGIPVTHHHSERTQNTHPRIPKYVLSVGILHKVVVPKDHHKSEGEA
jgi:hypothetical protein